MAQRTLQKALSATPESTPANREVVRCQACGLVQYRTRTGNCRRCLRVLPPPPELRVPPPVVDPAAAGASPDSWANQETVGRIGDRIRQLREARGLTQSQLQQRSCVSRSYLSRIESGQMTPSLGTLEKIAHALGVSLNRFFLPPNRTEALLEDPFIQSVRPYLRQLDLQQWRAILQRLQVIAEHASRSALRPLRPPLVPHPPAVRGSSLSR